jgi:antirestriction protein ArdC
MPRKTYKSKGPKQSAHEIILASILLMLDKGVIPWHKPWTTSDSLVTTRGMVGKQYRGINTLILWCTGLTGPWFTFKQIKAMGGHVRKGEKGTRVVLWKSTMREDKTTGKENWSYFMRTYVVFSICQADEVNPKSMPAWYRKRQAALEAQQDPNPFNPIEQAEKVWEGFRCKPEVSHGKQGAWYKPIEDTIGMPNREAFDSETEYYSTLFHEGIHSTGAKHRVDRDLKMFFADHKAYSKEELIAEIGSAFLCGSAGITCEKTLANSAAYIQNWRKKLTEDPKLIVQAASAAQKAVDHILGVEFARKPEDKQA